MPDTRPDVQPVLDQLKDFQRATADYAFRRLYTDPNPTQRFLVADEVGLGKTLVARGVVARAVDHLWDDVERIDVLYVCSNLDIARQNINRLRLPGRKDIPLASRITLLPTLIHDLSQRRLNFISFTPGTSLEPRSAMGTAQERALLYLLLRRAWKLRGKAPLNVLQGTVKERDTFEGWVEWTEETKQIDETIAEAFAEALESHDQHTSELPIRERFEEVCSRFSRARRQSRIPQEDRDARSEIIGELRQRLAMTCVAALEPDLVILDEFQRFKHLLDGDDTASELARDLFEWQCESTGARARLLLLSATPYKMYTIAGADQEDHHEDFLATLRFLHNDAASTDRLAELFAEYKRELLSISEANERKLRSLRDEIQARLRSVMCRTERLGASSDRNGMLVDKHLPLRLDSSDVGGYLGVQRVARELGHGDTVEYWKSAPYLLNLMDQYQLKRRLVKAAERGSQDGLTDAIGQARDALLPWAAVESFEEITAANPRMRALVEEMIESGAWRLAWIPPSLPYYALGGPFAEPGVASLTKRLVFSSWAVVPKAVAALLTYAAERRMMRSLEGQPKNTPEARASRARLLDFRMDGKRPAGMPALAMIYPSLSLARACDPLEFAQSRPEQSPAAIADVLAWATQRVRELLERPDIAGGIAENARPRIDPSLHPFAWEGPEHSRRTPERALHLAHQGRFGRLAELTPDDLLVREYRPRHLRLLIELAERDGGRSAQAFAASCLAALSRLEEDAKTESPAGPDERWYWAAPLLLDLATATEPTIRWWSQGQLANTWTGSADEAEAATGWQRHVELARDVLAGELELGPQPDDLAHVLALLGTAGPATCALRALSRELDGVELDDLHLRNSAAKVAWGFRALLNVPETIALIRGLNSSEPYWQRVLEYALDGGIQAMLDEYAHVLLEHLGLAWKPASEAAEGVAGKMQAALTLRPALLRADAIGVTGGNGDRSVTLTEHQMRARFAARFGEERTEDPRQPTTRAGELRDAFNSPFWPFVLASTSVGQEGLDFHLYCHAVVHWNLPRNPVDLEQREGRVHRYKGHAVRRNVARQHAGEAITSEQPWRRAFELAALERAPDGSELVPYWLYPVPDGARVERHLPIIPLSRESDRLPTLIEALSLYRLALGHPRQDDLINHLLQQVDSAEIQRLLDGLQLDLSPLTI